jgi:hypothetical protein
LNSIPFLSTKHQTSFKTQNKNNLRAEQHTFKFKKKKKKKKRKKRKRRRRKKM